MIKTEKTLRKPERRDLRKTFRILTEDSETKARRALLQTAHGEVEGPCFMPCGTQGTVKALSSEDLESIGAQILLANAYHLYLRPGEEVFETIGTLHDFMSWKGAILTDSGGFQSFSLAPLRKITDEGLFFQSHIDGSKQFLTPEKVVQFQRLLGSDVMMVLDECVGYPSAKEEVEAAMNRTLEWAERSKKEFHAHQTPFGQLLFGIVQGGIYADLRKESCERLAAIEFDGYAIGGLGVGEPKELLKEMVPVCMEGLPSDKPRYLMWIGTPEDILEGIASGVDFFDCVLPTRNARNGQAFTKCGKLNMRNAHFAKEGGPLEEGCLCKSCRHYSRAYLHHLVKAREIVGMHLVILHNLHFYLNLMGEIRKTLREDRFLSFKRDFLRTYQEESTDET